MRILTEDADLRCDHALGVIAINATQNLVMIDGRCILIEPNPENCAIKGCPNVGPTIKPCQLTLAVQAGYSELLRIDGKRICLDNISGLTEGTPPGIVQYKVVVPGQQWVDES